MKIYKLILKFLFLVLMCYILVLIISSVFNSTNANIQDYRFIKIYERGSIKIYYDKETRVEYAVRDHGYGGTSMTLLVNSAGEPLLYIN